VDTLAETYIPLTSKTPGSAAERAEKAKIALYQELTKDYAFTPIAVETFGSWGQQGHSLIKEIGLILQEINNQLFICSKDFLSQCSAAMLQV